MAADDDIAVQPVPRRAIDVALAGGDLADARALADAYWRASPNASTARYLTGRLDQLWPASRIVDHRVAILRSFTVEPVMPLLKAEAALAGCRLATWAGEFGAYGQEILDPGSDLYAHRPDTVILAVQTRDVAPALWSGFAGLSDVAVQDEVAAAAASLGDLVEALRSRTAANILVHNLEPPLRLNEGLLDARRPMGQAQAIAWVNHALAERLAALRDVYLLDYADLQARHGRERFVSEKKWSTAKLPLSVDALGWLAHDWWRHLSLFALPRAKVLALDLDNTLWGGVIGEDGLAGIKLSDEYPGVFYRNLQRAALDIARRGVMLAVVSKNNEDDALRVLDEHPGMLIRREHLSGMRINWEPKAANLAALAQELNLGLESFVFLDDNPVEREAIRRTLPEVIVPTLGDDPSSYADILRDLPALERLTTSAEDGERARYYAQDRDRRDLMAKTESLDDFLASLDIAVRVTPVDTMSLARAAQLTQKTNQLNTTTRRYTETQLAERLATPGWAGYVLSASDRFGDNGVVGVAVTHTDAGVCEIDTLLLSCRVIGRQIETAFLSVLAARASEAGAAQLQGWFLPTAKNAPARAIYQQAGLACVRQDGDAQLWSLPLSTSAIVAPPWIRLEAMRP
jgi:FkbH-like protein